MHENIFGFVNMFTTLIVVMLSQTHQTVYIKYMEIFYINYTIKFLKKKHPGDFPDDPVVETPHFQFMGHGFNPWSGN